MMVEFCEAEDSNLGSTTLRDSAPLGEANFVMALMSRSGLAHHSAASAALEYERMMPPMLSKTMSLMTKLERRLLARGLTSTVRPRSGR